MSGRLSRQSWKKQLTANDEVKPWLKRLERMEKDQRILREILSLYHGSYWY